MYHITTGVCPEHALPAMYTTEARKGSTYQWIGTDASQITGEEFRMFYNAHIVQETRV